MGNPSRRASKSPPVRRRPTSHEIAVSPLLKGPDLKSARAIWSWLAPALARSNMLAPTDVDAFARYCIHLDEWSQYTATLRKEGSTQVVKTTSGDEMVRLHPAAKLREIAEKRLLDLEDRFGLNPRHRLAILRDMNALNVPTGDLFGWRDGREGGPEAAPEAAPHVAASEDADADIIGFARRLPAGSLPN